MKKVEIDVNPEIICQNLRNLRKFLGYRSARRFAEELGVKYTTYRNYEIDRMPPSELLYLIKLKFPRDVNIGNLFIQPEHDVAAQIGDGSQKIAERRIFQQNSREGIISHFEDKETARQAILALAEIEILDRAHFMLLAGEIKGTARALKPKKKA